MNAPDHHNHDDEGLRTLFARLRAIDAGCAPSFSSLWRRAEHMQPAGQRSSRWAMHPTFVAAGALAAVVCLVAISVLLLQEYRTRSDEAFLETKSLLQWESPTEALLTFAEAEVSADSASSSISASETDAAASDWEMPTDSLLPASTDDATNGSETS